MFPLCFKYSNEEKIVMYSKDTVIVMVIGALVVAALIVWFFPAGNGAQVSPNVIEGVWESPWDRVDTSAATASIQNWLETESGTRAFGSATAAGAVPVFNESSRFFLWIVPVRDDDGQYQNNRSYAS